MALAVQPAADHFDLPTRHLAGIVAALALPTAVGVDGEAVVGVALNVVDVPDRRITERIAAVPIPPHDQLPDVAVKLAAVRIATGQRSTDRRGVEPAPPQVTLAGRKKIAGQIGGQRPIAVQFCRCMVIGIQQRVQRHHDLQLDVHIGCLGLPSDPFHQCVSHV